ncbi:MAG: T9SS type A sorting domain-containing protein [Candidatus Cloacimonetes bacterium]|nr:T9SS type A sorting domain-containing protein [Candidatus Cloacimonadota bacterium]
MKKYLFILLIFLFSTTLWSRWIDLPEFPGKKLVEYEQAYKGNISLQFNLDGYNSEEIVNSGCQYIRLSHPKAGRLLISGMPDLPVFTRLVAIPDEGEVTLNIISSEYQEINNIMIYPQEELAKENENRADTFSRNEDYYQRGGVFPEQIAGIGEPVIMRDLRLIPVTFSPFCYDAAHEKLYVYQNISVEIITSGQGGINCRNTSSSPSRAFADLYGSKILNYSEVAPLRDEFQRPAVLFIYPQVAQVLNNLQFLIDWKEKKGFEVTAVSTSTTGASNNSIKNYIQDAYDNWENPPEYVILVGDVNGSIALPSWYDNWSGANGIGDHPYSLLDGTDILADIIIGRLSVNSIANLQTVIAKTIAYEREPYLDDTDWYHNAVLVAYGEGTSKISTCKAAKQYMHNYNSAFTFDEVYSGNLALGINQGLNGGASYFCGRGQGGFETWGEQDINNLTNGRMLSFFVAITCFMGDFNGNCVSELITKAGNTTNFKGAVAAVGTATGETSTCFNNSMAAGIFYGIFVDEIYTPGGALVSGKLNLYLQYPQNPYNQVNANSYWNNLMGDPSLELWTDIPQPMTVFYNDEVAFGTNSMQISVLEENGTPLRDAWITARGDDYYQTGFTDNNGCYYLNLEGAGTTNYYELTITSHNKIPFEEVFYVVNSQVNLDIEQLAYDDSNGNGIPNPGENINLELTIANYGLNTALGVNAELISHSDYVTVTAANAALGDIPSTGSVLNSALSVSLAAATPGGTQALLELVLTSAAETWNIPFSIAISGAFLNIIECVIANTGGVINPGETAEIYFSVQNSGETAAFLVSGSLISESCQVEVIDGQAVFGAFMPGDEVNNNADRFEIYAHETIIPGTQIPLSIHFTSPDGYDNTSCFLLDVGIVTQNDPLGPDVYGYYCYGDEDTAYDVCPTYDWVEINIIGDALSIYTPGQAAAIEDVNLPCDFHFYFYGEEYNLITVASSGWICPGGTEVASFMNWTLPGPHGPSPMIAAFWDDLHNSSGHVYTFYDADLHQYIIEWYQMRNEHANELETFQIILYDSEIYPTITGDSMVKIQYNEFNNTNTGQYPYHNADHGQYCTIGLEDHTAGTGLQYTYNNTYPAAAGTISDQSALLFTTQPLPQNAPWLKVTSFVVSAGGDEYLEAGETAILSIMLENIGSQTATDISITITENDPYLEIIESGTSISLLPAGGSVELADAFSFVVSENIPDYYDFILHLTALSQEDGWDQDLSLTAYLSNTFAIDVDSIAVELLWGDQTSTAFNLTNIGNLPVNFYLRLAEIVPPARNITGSYITCDTQSFIPGEEATWIFTVYNASQDNEWVSDVWLDFPQGVTVISAGGVIGGGGGEMVWDGTTGAGQRVNWHGVTANGWGFLHENEFAEWRVNVQLSDNFAGDMTIGWEVGGDGYGAEPHNVTGDILMLYPLRWINLDMSSGFLPVNGSQSITVNFDTSDVEELNYYCNILVSSDSWDGKTIPVILSPQVNNNQDTQVPGLTLQLHNYPNPFNPVTAVSFYLPESGNVILNIYNIKGQKVATLAEGFFDAGEYNITWTGTDDKQMPVSSGIYTSKLTADGKSITSKMLLLK